MRLNNTLFVKRCQYIIFTIPHAASCEQLPNNYFLKMPITGLINFVQHTKNLSLLGALSSLCGRISSASLGLVGYEDRHTTGCCQTAELHRGCKDGIFLPTGFRPGEFHISAVPFSNLSSIMKTSCVSVLLLSAAVLTTSS
jgi:hypothetical protein